MPWNRGGEEMKALRAMWMVWISSGLLLLLHPAILPAAEKDLPKVPALASKTRSEIKDLIKTYFKAGDATARADAVRKLKAFDPVPKKSLREFTRLAFKYMQIGTRLELKHRTTLDTPSGTGTLLVSGVKKRRMQPLLIGLHGGGAGSGDGANSEQKWQSAMGKGAICVFPTVVRKTATAWNTEREEKYVLAILDAVKRTCRVDTNRIYLVGHSMGGFGTWSIGGHYADVFAALSPNAGGIIVQMDQARKKVVGVQPGCLPNLHNTPVYFFHSTDDRQVGPTADQFAAKRLGELAKEHPNGYEHVYKEYTDIGHGMPPDGVGPIFKYLFSRKREPYPLKVVFEPRRAYKRLFAWVEVPQGSGVRRICAEVDKKKNRVDVKTQGADRGFILYFKPKKMLDLEKEVTVTVNGKERFRGHVRYSVAALVHTLGELRDPARYFSARIAFP